MVQGRVELFIKGKTEDITESFKGYTKFKAETVRGNLWFCKNRLQIENAVKIEEEKIYDLEGFVQIQNLSKGKSMPSLTGYLF